MRILVCLFAVIFSGICLPSVSEGYEWRVASGGADEAPLLRDAPRSQNPPAFKKVMIVIFENTDYKEALEQPFFARFAKEGALLTNFHAEGHPSQPNYIALISGDMHGVDSDSNVNLTARHIGDLLEEKHKSWKVYAEKYPGHCFLGKRSGTFVRKHTPFLSFVDVQSNPERCGRIVEAGELPTDIANRSLPDFSLYIPDLNDDGHDTNAKFADEWFEKTFAPLLKNSAFIDGMLLVATFDEDDSKWPSRHGNNHIFTALYGSSVLPGAVSAHEYNHYSLLRTIEDTFGLGTLNLQDAKSTAITGVWR